MDWTAVSRVDVRGEASLLRVHLHDGSFFDVPNRHAFRELAPDVSAVRMRLLPPEDGDADVVYDDVGTVADNVLSAGGLLVKLPFDTSRTKVVRIGVDIRTA